MYTAIDEQSGGVLFALHQAPEEMDPSSAREALAAIEPVMRRST